MRSIHYKVGQKLWLVTMRGGRPVEVTKVGRKWVQLGDRLRVAVGSIKAEEPGYGGVGEVWISQEVHAAAQSAAADMEAAWEPLRKHFSAWHPPPGTTFEQLTAIREILGLAKP